MAQRANTNTAMARRFHDGTKYLALRDEAGAEQFLMGTPPNVEEPIWQQDWSIEPFPYKVFESLEPLPIPREFPATTLPALEAIGRTGTEPQGERIPDRDAIARIGLLSNGILKRGAHRAAGEIIEYRAAGGTGARYHLELYAICGDLPGLEAGIYHYSAQDHSLRQVRSGDYRGAVVAATGGETAVTTAPAILAMTSTFWRNAWRYKARAYRHAFWDAATTFTNVLALAASQALPTKMVFGFADGEINALLGVDGTREATLALCTLGHTSADIPNAPVIDALDLPTRPISSREVAFPLIGEMHAASSLRNGTEVAQWRRDPLQRPKAEITGELVPLQPVAAFPSMAIEELITRRRSTRNYDTDVAIPFDAFSTLVVQSTRGFAADCLALDARPLHDQYLIVNAVEGLEPGVYKAHPDRQAIERVRTGTFRQEAERLAAGQAYAGAAHVNSYFLTELDPVLARYGNRGYRVAQFEAALYGSRLHLGTHALGLGAVGSTSFDDEVVAFFTPGSSAASYMFVLVFGKRRRMSA